MLLELFLKSSGEVVVRLVKYTCKKEGNTTSLTKMKLFIKKGKYKEINLMIE